MDLMSAGLLLGSMYTAYEMIDKLDIGNAIVNKAKTHDEYCLVLGYRGLLRTPIIVNMKVTPHLLVCGLSGQGKSRCVEYAARNRDCVLLNSYESDFPSLKCPRINGNKQILEYLTDLLNNPIERKRPLYVICDECLMLCHDKAINKCMMELLATGRHQSVFCINIAQRGLKTDLPWKDLHNARMTFRQVEPSSYAAILGFGIDKNLTYRNFALASDDVYFGKTYNV